MKKKQTKPIVRPNSSHPNNYRSAHINIPPKESTLNIPSQDMQTEEIKLKNEQL